MNPKPIKQEALTHVNWLLFFSILLMPISLIDAAPNMVVERISRSELKPLKDGMQGEEGLEKEVALAANVKLHATIEVTAKGNGTLRIGNLELKIFDSHSDGSYYENEMLKIEFSDINGDGQRELIISGIVCFTDEKSDRVLRREAVVFIYELQPSGTLKEVYRNTNFRLD